MFNLWFLCTEQNNIFYSFQLAFRDYHSTTHALYLDNPTPTHGVYLDLKKAFDTVNHKIFLSKLNHYRIRGIANDWFKSFLVNRTQYTNINGSNSNPEKVLYGIPKCSVLGPLLFIIFINDLNVSIKSSKVHHFADDTNLLLNKSLKQINKHKSWLSTSSSNQIKSNISFYKFTLVLLILHYFTC